MSLNFVENALFFRKCSEVWILLMSIYLFTKLCFRDRVVVLSQFHKQWCESVVLRGVHFAPQLSVYMYIGEK